MLGWRGVARGPAVRDRCAHQSLSTALSLSTHTHTLSLSLSRSLSLSLSLSLSPSPSPSLSVYYQGHLFPNLPFAYMQNGVLYP
jgi:hypothetical protein